MSKKIISIKDIAKTSGVSVATVSRIINNNGRFSLETKKKVETIIKQLGYEKNKFAVGLRSNQSKTIGILVPDITNPFYATIVKKSEQLFFEKGYATIICNTERSVERENAYLKNLFENRVDGLMIISSNINQTQIAAGLSVPTVFIDKNPNIPHATVISSDHYRGAELATELLIQKKLSPYLLITKTKSSSTLSRIQAFKDILNQRGFKDISSRILSLNITSDNFLSSDDKLNSFMVDHANSTQPLGLFGINDNIAYMAIQAATKIGLSVPGKINVIGFDGTLYSELSSPKITTVVQNTDEITRKASNKLIEKMTNRESAQDAAELITIPVKLVIKESTV
ncbi:MAG: LacI family DNA-binding transcriptional regulator [Liquorilactobacillus satsumensis]|uniref:LacI family DNA-binding transcriptional regulator n=1 Tax=Liquorilactobacillus TaxID=2767888 RepID=UPI0039ECE2F7